MSPRQAPVLDPDLEAGLRRLKLAAVRRMAPEVLKTAKVQRWAPDELLRTFSGFLAERLTPRVPVPEVRNICDDKVSVVCLLREHWKRCRIQRADFIPSIVASISTVILR